MTIAARRDVLAEIGEIRGRSLWQDARRRLFRTFHSCRSLHQKRNLR